VGIATRLTIGTAAIAVLLTFAPAVAAQTGDDAEPAPGVTLEVAAGIDSFIDPSRPVRFALSLTSEELLVGRLDVSIGGGVTASTAVEVPAGGVKRYEVEVPAPFDRRRAAVSLVKTTDGEDEELVAQTLQLRVPNGEVLVGVLDAADAVTALRSAIPTPVGGDIVTITVDEAAIERGLAPAAYLVAGTGAVRGLGEPAREALERWVNDGGRLVGAADDLVLIGEPATGSLFPGTAALVAREGDGEIVAVADVAAVTVEEWSRLIRDPIPVGLIRDQQSYGAELGLVSAASTGRNVGVPALSWLLLGILLFVVMVGPVNFVLLRGFDKPELAWLTVPFLSVVFVAGFWFVGRSSVADFTLSHAALLVDSGRGTDGEAGIVVQVESGGSRRLTLPQGWSAVPIQSFGGSDPGAVEPADPGSVDYDLEDLGAGTAQAQWHTEPLAVNADYHMTGGDLAVTVRNDTPWTWWSWGVVVNGAGYPSREILAPGATGTVTARVTVRNINYEPVIASAVDRSGLRYTDAEATRRYEASYAMAEYAETRIGDLRGSDLFVFGLTEGFEPSPRLDGSERPASGTTLLVKQFELPAETTMQFGSARPELLAVSGSATVEAYYQDIYVYGANEIFLRYLVPEGVTGRVRVAPGGTSMTKVAAWNWADGEFSDISWGDEFLLADYLSPGGELVIRGTVGPDDVLEEALQLPRFGLVWSTS